MGCKPRMAIHRPALADSIHKTSTSKSVVAIIIIIIINIVIVVYLSASKFPTH